MKNIIVCGSRSITDEITVYRLLDRYSFLPWRSARHIMHGGATGIDTLFDKWVRTTHGREPDVWLPQYDQHVNKRFAPIARNGEMAEFAAKHGGGYVLALWDGRIENSGTVNMYANGFKHGLTVYVEVVK